MLRDDAFEHPPANDADGRGYCPADRTGCWLRKVADANPGRTYELWSPSRLGGADLAKIAAELIRATFGTEGAEERESANPRLTEAALRGAS